MPVRPEGEAEPRPSGPAAAPDSAPAGAADWRGVLTAVWLGGAGVLAAALLACNLRFYLRLRRMRRTHPIPGVAVPVYVAALPLPVRLPAARGLSDPGGGRRTGAAGPRPAP